MPIDKSRFKSLRTYTNIYVFNMAISDLLMATTGFPLFIYSSLKGTWGLGKLACELYGASGAAFSYVSINSMSLISLEKCRFIASTVDEKHASVRGAIVTSLFCWLYSLTWAVLPLMGWSRYNLEGFGTTCSFDYASRYTSDKYFIITVYIMEFGLPLLIIIVSYSIIFRIINKRRPASVQRSRILYTKGLSSTSCSESESSGQRMNMEYKVLKVIFIVILLFCIAWLPYAVVGLISVFSHTIHPIGAMLACLLAKSSTAYNPIVYAIKHPRFKGKIAAVLRNAVERARETTRDF
ncbi:DgyrCDS3270 [Dimorphilus gyrociliatus]|uniref:DgyrCDS3270 n=1 Tax=Dimorphilus gyrociliatus TaxID=2664684 RepID=A0A7I8VD54_9ANNE|nr:DgyrCDS3270 [Dimorphilus gyrociliatus]